jgi:indole-3-glycerol phosphate synthase
MNILDKIMEEKFNAVDKLKQNYTKNYFEQQPAFKQKCISLKNIFKENVHTNIIAEFKRQSPSKGIINATAKVKQVVQGYQKYGAAAVSILTEENHFGGKNQDIIDVRKDIVIPILRKDFIMEEVQILEAKALGADVILLIAACLSPKLVKQLSQFAQKIGLEVLLELHTEEELNHVCETVDFVGINNRNLKTFEVNLEQSIMMKNKIGKSFLTIAESGISSIADINYLKNEGFDGFLIGELFMKNEHPISAFKDFMSQL